MSRIARKGLAATTRIGVLIWLPIAILAFWIFASRNSSSFYVPKFDATMVAIGKYFTMEGFQTHVLPTVTNLLAGFIVAVFIGVVLGLIIGRVRWLHDATAPIFSFMRSIPPPALLPIAMVLLGIGPQMRIGLIAFGAVWPTLLSTIDAVRNVDSALGDIARVYAIRRWRQLLHMTLPAIGPMVMAGVRTSLLYSITLIVLSEMVGASAGLGHSVLLSQRTFQVADMWAAIIMLGLLGLALNAIFVAVENTVLRWHRQRNTERGGSWIA